MKAIPINDLLKLLQNKYGTDGTVFESDVESLFEEYGDDWYIDDYRPKYTLYHVNENRVKCAEGKWIRLSGQDGPREYDNYQCSRCNYKTRDRFMNTNFCPNCGADMREGEDEN